LRLRPLLPILVLGVTLAPHASLAQSSAALGHYRLGVVRSEEGDWPAALKEFEQAYALDPKPHRGERIGMHFEDYDPAFQLGRVHARLGNFREAARYFAQCASGGYTERSANAEEFRRWRAAVERALVAAAPTLVPSPPTRPTPTATPPTPPAPPPSTALPPPTAIVGAILRASPTALRTAGPVTAIPIAALARMSPAAPVSTPRPRRSRAVAFPQTGGIDKGLLVALVAFAASLALLGLLRRERTRRPPPLDDRAVPLGRYRITGLLGSGRHSFVYDARDRSEKRPVALRVRRPDLAAEATEPFSREIDALEELASRSKALPVPGLYSRSVHRGPGGSLEYAVLERLSGRSLFDLSHQARRRLDPTLSLEILHEIAAALRRLRAADMSSPELSAEDVFLLDPVPSNAGNPIHLKILGATRRAVDSAREATAIAALASELFRGRTERWEEDDWVISHIPAPVREALLRAREGDTISLEELERILRDSTGRGETP